MKLLPFAPAGETEPQVRASEVASPSYRIDNVKGRCAVDVEWQAKDGNLDRDIAAYRALYDAGTAGALCDDATRERLRTIGESYDWDLGR